MTDLLTDPFSADVDTSITVIELPSEDAVPAGIVGGIVGAYRHDGYEAGYARALRDVVGSLALAKAEFLREHPRPTPQLRRILSNFETCLRRQLDEMTPVSSPCGIPHSFEGGLGI